MYFQTSQRYKDTIYNSSVQSVVNIYIDGVLLNPKYLTDFKMGCELFDDNFELGSIPSQYIEIQIHKKSGIVNPKTIRIEYGILVNNALTVAEVNKMLICDLNKLQVKSLSKNDNSFEMIPIGTYNVDDYNDEDDNVINIKALDNIIKLDKDDGYYDASELINKKGYATLGEIAQDICTKKGLELETSSFINSDNQISVYDNQLSAREYMSYIAEKAGCFCCASRYGKIQFRQIGQDTVEIPLKLFKTYKFGEEYKISRVAFEDGVRSFKFGNETRNTLWIRQDNLFVTAETEVQNIYNEIKDLTINSFEGTVIIDPAIDIGDKIIIDGKAIIYQGEMTLNKRFIADINSKINIKQKEETTVKKESQTVINRRVQSRIDEAEGKITQLVEENTETSNKLSEHEQTIDSMKDTLKSQETKIETVESKADTATSKANNAQTTANTANTNAQNAQKTANANTTKITTNTTKIAEVEKTVDGITQSVSKAEEKIETTDNKINNLSIGATNLLRGTNSVTTLTSTGVWSKGTWRKASSGTGTRESISVTNSPNANIKLGWHITSTNAQVTVAQDSIPTANGQEYVLSCYAKGTGKLALQYGNGTVGYQSKLLDVTSEWKRYSFKFISKGEGNAYFGVNVADHDIYVCGMKLEQGNIATDWSPAPEDIESNLVTNYYTKTETENKITQTAESTISEVSKTYSTKTETANAKTEAINSANSSTDNKLKDYTVTNKLGTFIEQNYEHVKVAWNQISEFIQMMIINNNASLAILDENKKVMMALDKTGQHFYKSDGKTVFGEMGVQKIDDKNYISFSVEGEYSKSISDGMAWGIKTKSDNKFYPILYVKNFEMPPKNSDGGKGQLILDGCDLYLGSVGSGITTGEIKIFGEPRKWRYITFYNK